MKHYEKKNHFIIDNISVLSFASCGNSTTEEPETTVPVETTVEATPEPTATPKPTFTPDAENTTTSEAQSKSEINGNDSQTSEGEVYEEVTETPAPETKPSNNGYSLDEESKAYLKGLGATDAEINNLKLDDDVMNLINKLFGVGGSSTGNSGSTAGGGSSSANTGSSGATDEDVLDPSMIPQGIPDDQVLPGYM